MRFEPKSDKELYGLLDKGEYDFEIVDAMDTESRAGNPMLVVTAKVFGPEKEHIIKDYIVNGAKLKRLCEAIGMMGAYNSGNLPATDLPGCSGRCKVGIEESEQYGDKNRIAGYVPAGKPTSPSVTTADQLPASSQKSAKAPRQTVPDAPPPDDDTPF